jgi:hypothetical protein
VSESHPIVKRLVKECKYDKAVALEAVMLNEDFETALDYLSRRVVKDAGATNDKEMQIFSIQGYFYAIVIIIILYLFTYPYFLCSHSVHVHRDSDFEKQFLSLDDVGSILGKLSEQLPGMQ